jgi:hypothetical protein
MKNTKKWEYVINRPLLPGGWDCFEQRGGARCEETSYTRYGKDHPDGELKRFWIVLCEFNPHHWSNANLGYQYSVRGSNDTKPVPGVKHFHTLKEANDYIMYLAESTNQYIYESTSPEAERVYRKKVEDIKKMTARKQ